MQPPSPGGSERVLLIAEIGSTHDGSLGIARNSARTAIARGAGAVKFQTHIAAAETVRHAPAPAFFSEEPRFDYFQRTSFSAAQWTQLAQDVHGAGGEFISSPFSNEAVELLERTGIDRYKVPSGEVSNVPLIRAIADTHRPVLLSSGMSSWAELDAAVDAVLRVHASLVVLQCTSEYPCPYERVGLDVMLQMRDRYGVPVGLSDHTLTSYAAIAAVTLGAAVVEKHFTLSRELYGSDAKHSMEPDAFADLAAGIEAAQTMRRATVDKDDVARYADMRQVFQKSVVATTDIPAGTRITRAMLGLKKPGTGIPPSQVDEVVGRVAGVDIPADSVIAREWVGLVR